MQDDQLEFDKFLRWERASRDTIDFKKIYVDMCDGDILMGLMLSEIVYWYLGDKLRVQHDGYFWIACTRYEWWGRTRMSPNQIDYVTEKLTKLGLLVKGYYLFDRIRMTHVRIEMPVFLRLWNTLKDVEVENPFSPTSEISEDTPRNIPKTYSIFSEDPSEKTPTAITESTSETTQKTAGNPQDFHAPSLTSYKDRGVKPDRSAERVTDRDAREKKKVSPTDAEFPAVGRLVLDIMDRHGGGVRNLTGNQIDDLRAAVIIPTRSELYPSPEDELRDYPEAFKSFVQHIEEMAWWTNPTQPARWTPGNVIKAIRGYHWIGGWFVYKPGGSGIQVEYTDNDDDAKRAAFFSWNEEDDDGEG